MEKVGRYSRLLQEDCHLLGQLAISRVDDSRTGHFSEYVGQCAQLVFRTAHDIGEIRADKTFPEDIFFLEKQSSLYVVHDFGCGGCRQCQYRYAGQLLPYIGDVEVGRTEVIAPLRDTMTLVYH